MGFLTSGTFLFVLFCTAHTFPVDPESLEVVISRGVSVEEVKNVIMYTELQFLHFLIPDLPDLPKLDKPTCSTARPITEACAISMGLNDINQDSLLLLGLMNKLLTRDGLGDVSISKVEVPSSLVQVDETDESNKSEPPPEQLIRNAGLAWYTSIKERLEMRKIDRVADSTVDSRSNKTKRALPVVGNILKGVTAVSAFMGLDDLIGSFASLFVSKDKILNMFTQLRNFLPIDRQAFSKVVERVSTFEDFSRKKFADILLEKEVLKNVTRKLDADVKAHRLDISTIQDGFGHTQRNLADLTTIMFTTAMYLTQFSGFQDCRAQQLSLLYVPRSLLHKTLVDLELALPKEVEMVISPDNAAVYYTLPNIVFCLFDNDGGSVRLPVFLKERNAIFKLYSVRSIQFAWLNQSCYLNLESTLVVKEIRTGMVFPVTDLDEAECDPLNLKRCKVPPSSNDDIQSSCTSTILSGGTTSEIKEACEIKCSKHHRPEVSKVMDNVFILTHVIPGSLTVYCPTENVTISEKVDYGAIKVVCPCQCYLKLYERIVGRSTNLCNPNDVLSMTTLLPVHFTIAKDIVHFNEGGDDSVKFKSKNEIFNSEFMSSLQQSADDGIIATNINLISAVWNFFQSGFLIYMFYKVNAIAAQTLQISIFLPMISAQEYACKLPDTAYYLLLAILGFSVLAIVPQMLFLFFKGVRNCFRDTIEIEARKLNNKKKRWTGRNSCGRNN